MSALFFAVLLASLLGSPHCAGMCGPFVAMTIGSRAGDSATRIVSQAAYHGGRLLTYTLLGALAGALGAALDQAAALAGIQRFATVLAGALMIGFGSLALLRSLGLRIPLLPRSASLQNAVFAGHRAAATLAPTGRALCVGCMSTLLPCGWLYAFVITAAGTGGALRGALTMLAFWLGTLPILLVLGVGFEQIKHALGRRGPLITAGFVVCIGLLSVTQRSGLASLDVHAKAATPPESLSAAAERVAQLDSHEMPCCDHDD